MTTAKELRNVVLDAIQEKEKELKEKLIVSVMNFKEIQRFIIAYKDKLIPEDAEDYLTNIIIEEKQVVDENTKFGYIFKEIWPENFDPIKFRKELIQDYASRTVTK